MTDLQPVDPAVLAGLMAGRAAVEGYMNRREAQGHPWDETTATQQLCMAASPPIVYAEFTGAQEDEVGADWLWWWIDTTGEAFGMVVQAKKLHRTPTGTRWWVDFGYKRGTRSQITALLAASDQLNIPAGYMIYGGDTAYRRGLPCGPGHDATQCDRCERLSVSITPALVVDDFAVGSPSYGTPLDMLQWAFPLEDLADPRMLPGRVWDLHLRAVDPEIGRFLLTPQNGARHVARVVFDMVARRRRSQFSAALTGATGVDGDLVFRGDLPTDRGHLRQPYWPFVLRGLRRRAPQYVQDVAAGRPAPEWLARQVRGIVVVRLR